MRWKSDAFPRRGGGGRRTSSKIDYLFFQVGKHLGVEKRRRRLDVLDKKVHKTEEPLVKSSWCLIKFGGKIALIRIFAVTTIVLPSSISIDFLHKLDPNWGCSGVAKK